MTAEQLPPSALEVEHPRTPAAEFLYRVYDESEALFRSAKGARTIAEIRSQFVKRWNGNVLNLVKGTIVRSDRHDYGLVLGVRGFGEDNEDRLMLEFGKISHLDRPFDETLKQWNLYSEEQSRDQQILKYLDGMVHQPITGAHGSGRFYVDGGRVEIDCWTDLRMFGGRQIARNPYGDPRSGAGLGDYIDIVRELINRSWR